MRAIRLSSDSHRPVSIVIREVNNQPPKYAFTLGRNSLKDFPGAENLRNIVAQLSFDDDPGVLTAKIMPLVSVVKVCVGALPATRNQWNKVPEHGSIELGSLKLWVVVFREPEEGQPADQ